MRRQIQAGLGLGYGMGAEVGMVFGTVEDLFVMDVFAQHTPVGIVDEPSRGVNVFNYARQAVQLVVYEAFAHVVDIVGSRRQIT